MSLGRLRRQQDRLPEARTILARAVAALADDDTKPDASAARAFHAELQQPGEAPTPRPRRRSDPSV